MLPLRMKALAELGQPGKARHRSSLRFCCCLVTKFPWMSHRGLAHSLDVCGQRQPRHRHQLVEHRGGARGGAAWTAAHCHICSAAQAGAHKISQRRCQAAIMFERKAAVHM